ncbi:AAA family ATPase [Halobacillus mangrovi]|uniref:ATP-binding protein n=1 Tax=Halobacillus mangrovi TaxID=402384 RepID=UPI003D97376D
MNIKEIHIYGFGKWQNKSFFLELGQVNLLSGQNEAGKSTIHQFILFMLFGLTPKQREYYQPKKGGAIGGQLIISTEKHKHVVIERVHNQRNGKALCRLTNGEEYGEDWLCDLLKGTNREVYNSIFSFSAEDLLDLHRMSGSELGEVLLNIGLTGSDRIYETEKWFAKQVEQQFKPKGRNPIINQQLRVVEDVQKQRLAAEREEADYQKLQDHRVHLIHRINQSEWKIKDTRKKLYSYEQLLKAIPVISEYHQLQKQVNESEQYFEFPSQGRERYRQLRENLLPLESEKHLLETNLTEMNERLEELEDNQPTSDELEQGKVLLQDRNRYEQASHYKEQMTGQMEVVRSQLDQQLRHMDIPITEDEVTESPLPFYIEETWADLKNEAHAIRQEETRLNESGRELHQEKQHLEEKLEKLKFERISEKDANQYSKVLDESYRRTDISAINLEPIKQRRDLLFGFALFLFIAGGLAAWIISSILLGVFSTIAAILFIIGGMANHRTYQKNLQAAKESAAHVPELSVEEAREKLQQFEKSRAEYRHVKDRWKQLNQDEIRLDEKRRLLLQRKRRLEAGIQEQENLYPFLMSLDISHWDKLYHLLAKAKERSEEIESLQNQIESNNQVIQKIFFDLEKFYKDKNWESVQKSVDQLWDQLQLWVHKHERNAERVRQFHHEVNEVKQKIHEITLRLHSFIEKRDELFKQAGAEDEESFYSLADEHERLKEDQRSLQRLEQQINGMIIENEQQEFNIWEQTPDEAKLRAEMQGLNDIMTETEANLRELQQALSDTKNQLLQLENSGQLSELIHQSELEKDKLREHAKEWVRHQFAFQLLQKTKKQYMEKYLPEVIAKATVYFSQLTNDRYTDILLLSTEQQEMKLAHKNGQHFEVQELSRGAKDQLYVALRIALGETMAETLRLPFLMDDAFVHFDQDRLQVMLRILEEVASRHQVVLFTWRNDLQNHFSKVKTLILD